ncbi:unnamed protein product [[Candida] boidinii]|nr:unnamed protein product [[Candida] boidinii]
MAAHIGPTAIPIFSPVQPPAASITQQPNTSNIPQDNSDATNRVTNSSLLANNNTSSSSIDSNSSLERSGLEGRSDAVSSLRVSSSQPGFSYPVQQQQSSLQSQQQKQQQQQQQPQQQQQQQSQSNAQQQRTSCISALAQRFRGCQHSQRS